MRWLDSWHTEVVIISMIYQRKNHYSVHMEFWWPFKTERISEATGWTKCTPEYPRRRRDGHLRLGGRQATGMYRFYHRRLERIRGHLRRGGGDSGQGPFRHQFCHRARPEDFVVFSGSRTVGRPYSYRVLKCPAPTAIVHLYRVPAEVSLPNQPLKLN